MDMKFYIQKKMENIELTSCIAFEVCAKELSGEHRTHRELENTSTTSELNLCTRIVLGNIRKRGVRGELENKEYSRL